MDKEIAINLEKYSVKIVHDFVHDNVLFQESKIPKKRDELDYDPKYLRITVLKESE